MNFVLDYSIEVFKIFVTVEMRYHATFKTIRYTCAYTHMHCHVHRNIQCVFLPCHCSQI